MSEAAFQNMGSAPSGTTVSSKHRSHDTRNRPASTTPFFTIVIATYNRARMLENCLTSLSRLLPVPERYHEVVVVDNNSTDDTRRVVERHMPRFEGRLRYEFEAVQGKAHALNHGIRVGRGEFLAFTDDDAHVESGWLRAAAAAIRDHPAAAGFGGRVKAEWSTPIPTWLAVDGPFRLHKCAISGHDLGSRRLVYKQGNLGMALPVGVNLFLRARDLQRHGGFRTDLWPGEDTEIALRLCRAGEELIYIPDAVVFHPVEPDRLSKPYFRRWFYDKGRSMMRIDLEAALDTTRAGHETLAQGTAAPLVPPPAAPPVMLAGIPRYLIRMVFVEGARWLATLGDPVRHFHHEYRLCELWGQMREARRFTGRHHPGLRRRVS